MAKRGRSEQYTLDAAEQKRLLAEAKSPEDHLIVQLMMYLGMRASEVAHMRVNWVRSGEIHIPLTEPCDCVNCRKSKKKDSLWRCKSKAAVRSLPIPDGMGESLSKLLQRSPQGFHITRQAMWFKIKIIGKRANIKQPGLSRGTIFPHALRATAATRLAANGMSAAALCYIMGWNDITMGQHYVTIAAAKDEAHKQMRDILH